MDEKITNLKRNPMASAVFLGVSWTWCIGMFLPTLLVRDMGIWGWVVFAVPNVVGAAAMGFVLSSRTQSLRMVKKHAGFARAFSWVTIAFHFYFVKWFVEGRLGIGGAVWIFLGLIAGFWVWALRGKVAAGVMSMAGWVFSASVAGYCVMKGGDVTVMASTPKPMDAVWMAPVCLLGFLFCPYLDLTFHQGRLALGKASGRLGFAVGFGVFFLAMIVFSLMYAPWLAGVVEGKTTLPRGIAYALGLHMLAQGAITVALHLRALAEKRLSGIAHGEWSGLAAGLAALALGWFAGTGRLGAFTMGEAGYRAFLGFYGLVFPTYGVMCMWPRGREWRLGGVIRSMLVVLAAAPFFGVGFLMGKMIWLVPGVLVVALGWQQEGIIRRKMVAGPQEKSE